jgi:hypothetical protein
MSQPYEKRREPRFIAFVNKEKYCSFFNKSDINLFIKERDKGARVIKLNTTETLIKYPCGLTLHIKPNPSFKRLTWQDYKKIAKLNKNRLANHWESV